MAFHMEALCIGAGQWRCTVWSAATVKPAYFRTARYGTSARRCRSAVSGRSGAVRPRLGVSRRPGAVLDITGAFTQRVTVVFSIRDCFRPSYVFFVPTGSIFLGRQEPLFVYQEQLAESPSSREHGSQRGGQQV